MTAIPSLMTRTLWIIYGKDAHQFLAEQVTTHLPQPEQVRYSLYLNSAGRILSDLFIYGYNPEYYLLEIPNHRAEIILQQLQSNALNHQLDMRALDSLSVGTSPKKLEIHDGWVVQDPRHSKMGYRVISEETIPSDPDYLSRRLDLGLPESPDFQEQDALPIEYGLENLAVDFDKGCFIGQEVCTRMFRQKKGKFCVLPIQYQPRSDVGVGVDVGVDVDVSVGSRITLSGKNIGKLISCYPNHPQPIAFVRILKNTLQEIHRWEIQGRNLFLSRHTQPWKVKLD